MFSRPLQISSALVLLAIAAFAARAFAQCDGVCGDVVETGSINFADVVGLARYTQRADSLGLNLSCGDADNYAGITKRDHCAVFNNVFWGVPLDCQIDNGAYVPIANSTVLLHHNNVIPPGASSITVHFDISFNFRAQGLGLPVRVLVDSQAVAFGLIDSSGANGYGWEAFNFGDESSASVPPAYLFGGYSDYDYGVPAGRYPIGSAEILVSSSDSYRTITVELTEWPPGDNTPMLVEYATIDAYAINHAPWTVDLTGDFNNDRALTSGDVIGLVAFVFKSGPSPYPVPAAGDTNCNGGVTTSDIILLVNHVFKSGPPPCDVETECTINFAYWSCP